MLNNDISWSGEYGIWLYLLNVYSCDRNPSQYEEDSLSQVLCILGHDTANVLKLNHEITVIMGFTEN